MANKAWRNPDARLHQVSADNAIVAFDAEQGTERWRLKGPVVDRARNLAAGFQAEMAGSFDGRVFIPTNDSEVWAVDLATGEKRWGHEPGGGTFGTVIDDGQLFIITTGDEPSAAPAGVPQKKKQPRRKRWAARLNPSTGERVWQRGFDGLSMATPTVVGGVVIVPTAQADLLVLDRATGEQRARIAQKRATWWGACHSDGVAFIGVDDGRLVAFSTR